jgi:hypothetical protein
MHIGGRCSCSSLRIGDLSGVDKETVDRSRFKGRETIKKRIMPCFPFIKKIRKRSIGGGRRGSGKGGKPAGQAGEKESLYKAVQPEYPVGACP